MSILITESGNTLMMETVSGLDNASSLNDISVVTINKETFDTNPSLNGWIIGSLWVWDAVNLRLKIA